MLAHRIRIIEGIKPNANAIFGFGETMAENLSSTNLVTSTGAIGNDVTGVYGARRGLAAARYGSGKAIFGYGTTGNAGYSNLVNLVSSNGVVSGATTGVGEGVEGSAAAGYGTDKAIFAHGYGEPIFMAPAATLGQTILVSNTGVTSLTTTSAASYRRKGAAATYGGDKAIIGFGLVNGARTATTNLVSNTGVIASNTPGVGITRSDLSAAGYGVDKAIFSHGYNATLKATLYSSLVSNTGVVANDVVVTIAGFSYEGKAAATYGIDKAIFSFGYFGGTHLITNTGVMGAKIAQVGSTRSTPAAASIG